MQIHLSFFSSLENSAAVQHAERLKMISYSLCPALLTVYWWGQWSAWWRWIWVKLVNPTNNKLWFGKIFVKTSLSPCRSWWSLLKVITDDNQRFGLQTWKSWAELLGLGSGTAWADFMGQHKHRAFLNRLQLLLAATGSL